MRGHIRRRGKTGHYEYIIDVGLRPAQRCTICAKRVWVERRPLLTCPACGGPLRETEERRLGLAPGDKAGLGLPSALSKLCVAIEERRHVPRSHVTLREFLRNDWLPAIAVTVRPTTYAHYTSNCEQHIIPFLGSMPLQRLDGVKLNALYGRLLTDGRIRGGGGLSAASVRRVHATLHRAFRDAMRWGYLLANPASAADPPREHVLARERPSWSSAELAAFLRSVESDRLYGLWRLLAMSGCRRGEALGLRWDDLDLESGAVRIRRALIPLNGKLIESEPKTARGRRTIALDAETLSALQGHAARQLEEQRFWEAAHTASRLVFTRENGAPLHPERITARFRRLVCEAALPTIPLHGLRHTHASLALALGINPRLVSERLGHSTVAFTLDVYAHVLPKADKEAAERVAELLGAATSAAD
jgi:integrase